MTKNRKFPLPPKKIKNFQKELEEISKLAVLFPCKKDKLYAEFQQKGAHLLKDENLPDIGEQFDKDYEKRY